MGVSHIGSGPGLACECSLLTPDCVEELVGLRGGVEPASYMGYLSAYVGMSFLVQAEDPGAGSQVA